MSILDLVFPKQCISCGKKGRYVCSRCIGEVNFSKQLCIVCGRASIDGATHTRCQKPFGLDGSVSIWKYEKVVRESIIKLKYKFAYEIAKELSFYISNFLKENITALSEVAVLTPVPLYKTRKNWRGFNQSVEVGKMLAKDMGWSFVDDIVVRTAKTKPQTELKGKERLSNIRGVFGFNDSYKTQIADCVPLIIFDDVWTTGTTLKEMCKVLKRNGAKKVWSLTIAK